MNELIHQLCPPILRRHLKGLFGTVRWHGDFPDWRTASRACPGYEAPQIAQNVLEKTLAVINGRAAFERDGVAFSEIQYNWPALACLFSAAQESSGCLEVLDFGGSLGSFFHQHRLFLSSEKCWRWHVVEQPHYVELGKSHVHVPGLFFHDSIEECLSVARPTFACLSGVLQYLPDPWAILHGISSFTHLLIDRTAFTDRPTDRLTTQRVSGGICRSQYPCRFFSRREFLREISTEWELRAEWEGLIDPCNLAGCGFRGLFLKRRDV